MEPLPEILDPRAVPPLRRNTHVWFVEAGDKWPEMKVTFGIVMRYDEQEECFVVYIPAREDQDEDIQDVHWMRVFDNPEDAITAAARIEVDNKDVSAKRSISARGTRHSEGTRRVLN